MAGAYDDAPGRRMAWDADGTVFLSYGTDLVVTDRTSDATNMNQEADVLSMQSIADLTRFAFVFPELREIDGVFVASRHITAGLPDMGPLDTSANTTNGVDGTWNQDIADLPDWGNTYANFRDEITSTAVATEKGVRIQLTDLKHVSNGMGAIHLYGEISPAETPDRLLFLDTENGDAEFTKVLDFGDIPRGQTTTRTFKLINNSSSKTINTIQITAEDLYLQAGDWYEFGEVAGPYQATYNIGNLTNGSEELVELKQVIPDGETLGVQVGRIKVSHASVT